MANKVYQVPYGTKDILPGEMKARRKIENSIINVFDKWGYDEVQTPDFEYVETFGSTGDESNFRFFDKANKLLMLRTDMTAPIARLAATRLESGEKIKRLCYLANLYRYEEIQAGRQCEFEQAGVELLGASGPAADAEIIVLAAEAFKAAGIENFAISIGHVDFVNGLAREAGFNEDETQELKACLRRHDAVAIYEMARRMQNISQEIQKLFADFVFLQGGIELIDRVAKIVKDERSLAALENLRKIYELLEAYGASKYISFDLGLYRSFNYYTGMLFEMYLPEMGYPVAGGGRYDKMMKGFGMDCPATGFALGVDRLMLALSRLGQKNNRSWDALVAFPEGKLQAAIQKATALRAEGKSVKLATEAMTLEEAAKESQALCCTSLVYIA
ncbi:MAG: ATP phosphoribosyltransferase regulatory subunit [Phascolarctobacterium sp.]|nr:ATP phosphoribosyltransferase regulatory subunit [Phascolarctobacterium sp.]